MKKLYVISGPVGGLSYNLVGEVTTIGRSPENHIQINDRSISRKHARITREGDKFFIEDLKSHNGTLIDGWPVKVGEKFEIKQGIRIAIGNIICSLGKPNPVDGMITQYSMDVSTTDSQRLKQPLYKDKQFTNQNKLELIYEVSTVLMQSLDINEICQKIMDSLFAYLPKIDGGAIILMDDQTKDLKVVINRSRKREKKFKLNYSRTIVKRVIRDGQALLMSDISEDDQYEHSSSIDSMQIKSIMCVALASKSKTRGVIYVHSISAPHEFQKDDLLLLNGLASPAALAIENAMLFLNRKKAEKALRDSEEKYRVLFDNANDSIFITQDDVIKFPNPKAKEMLGYSTQEFTNISFEALIHPEDRYLVLQKHLKRMNQSEPPLSQSFRVISKWGDELWVQLNVITIIWEGRPATLNFLRDITSEKKMEAQLLQAQKMEAIGTLAGGIAHDFNNILSAILGYAELVTFDVPEGTKARENLGEVIKGGQRAKDLVYEILTFSRHGGNERKLVYIGPIVKEALKLIRASLPSTIDIQQEIADDEGFVEADSTQIHQLIMNLCTNAGHAMSEKGGILEVSLSYLDGNVEGATFYSESGPVSYLKLVVKDTGEGMDKDVLSRVFEPYFTTKAQGEGTGLGLAVVHGIVKSHGGAITAQSELEMGSTFEIFFPVVKNAVVDEPEVEKEPLATGTEHILFVDDEPTLVGMGKQMLERLGYKVVTRTSSTKALDLFKKNPKKFDLVITDMTMPHMTGEILAKKLWSIRPKLPIVLCTGYSEKISEDSAKKMGISEFIMKPLVIHDLAKATRSALDRK